MRPDTGYECYLCRAAIHHKCSIHFWLAKRLERYLCGDCSHAGNDIYFPMKPHLSCDMLTLNVIISVCVSCYRNVVSEVGAVRIKRILSERACQEPDEVQPPRPWPPMLPSVAIGKRSPGQSSLTQVRVLQSNQRFQRADTHQDHVDSTDYSSDASDLSIVSVSPAQEDDVDVIVSSSSDASDSKDDPLSSNSKVTKRSEETESDVLHSTFNAKPKRRYGAARGKTVRMSDPAQYWPGSTDDLGGDGDGRLEDGELIVLVDVFEGLVAAVLDQSLENADWVLSPRQCCDTDDDRCCVVKRLNLRLKAISGARLSGEWSRINLLQLINIFRMKYSFVTSFRAMQESLNTVCSKRCEAMDTSWALYSTKHRQSFDFISYRLSYMEVSCLLSNRLSQQEDSKMKLLRVDLSTAICLSNGYNGNIFLSAYAGQQQSFNVGKMDVRLSILNFISVRTNFFWLCSVLGDIVFVIYDLVGVGQSQDSYKVAYAIGNEDRPSSEDTRIEQQRGLLIAIVEVGAVCQGMKNQKPFGDIRSEAIGEDDKTLLDDAKRNAVIKAKFGSMSARNVILKPSRILRIPHGDRVLVDDKKKSWFQRSPSDKYLLVVIPLPDEAAEILHKYIRCRATVGSGTGHKWRSYQSVLTYDFDAKGKRTVGEICFR